MADTIEATDQRLAATLRDEAVRMGTNTSQAGGPSATLDVKGLLNELWTGWRDLGEEGQQEGLWRSFRHATRKQTAMDARILDLRRALAHLRNGAFLALYARAGCAAPRLIKQQQVARIIIVATAEEY